MGQKRVLGVGSVGGGARLCVGARHVPGSSQERRRGARRGARHGARRGNPMGEFGGRSGDVVWCTFWGSLCGPSHPASAKPV